MVLAGDYSGITQGLTVANREHVVDQPLPVDLAERCAANESGSNKHLMCRLQHALEMRRVSLRQRKLLSKLVERNAPSNGTKLAGYLESPAIVFNRYPVADRSLPARYARTIARFMRGGLEPALPEVDALIREHPGNPYFHELKAEFLMRTGKAREALPLLRQALKLHAGEAPLISVRLAEALISSDEVAGVDEAVRLSRQALINDPDPGAYRLLANGLYKKGQTPQADLAIAEAHFLTGDLKQAQIFAKRSQRGLKEGSPESLRAGDIVNYKIPTGSL